MTQALQIIIYIMCFITSVVCAVMLLRGFRRSGTRLLLWSGFCFSFLSLNNLAVLFDILVFPGLDLQAWRHAAALVAVSVLLIGLVWESE